jgi:uncharacterized protein
MAIEVTPLGAKCNLRCQYCYQHPLRATDPFSAKYDLNTIKSAILDAGSGAFCLFGGEPLLMKREDIEDLWAWGLSLFGRNSIQTNGTLIDADLIKLFRRYRVTVGISCDGPGELNDARWCGNLQATRRATAKVEQTIESLCREQLHPSLIVTLSRLNAAAERLPALHDWIRRLDGLGIRRVRLHLLEVDNEAIRSRYALTASENVAALLGLARLENELQGLKFDLFTEMRDLLQGRDHRAACSWKGCDPYTTDAVAGITGDGRRTNCGRTDKEGIDYEKSASPGFERYLALYFTPQEAGGCRDCRFFLMCKGQCPGTAWQGDWRNKTEHCEVWRAIYGEFERELLARGAEPLSVSPRRKQVEQVFIADWLHSESPSMSAVL